MVKRKAIFLFCKGLKAHCICLQETHSCEEDTSFWKKQWGDEIFFSHGSNRSGGVAICLCGFPGEVVTSKVDKDGHWIAGVVKLEGAFAILINIYGFNTISQNKRTLGMLTEIIADYNKMYGIRFTLIGGDLQ